MSGIPDHMLRRFLRDGILQITPTPEWLPRGRKPDIQPASIDLHLHSMIRRYKRRYGVIKLGAGNEEATYPQFIDENPFLEPGEFVIGSTVEKVRLSKSLTGIVNAKSSIGRDGLTMEIAGFVDPGFSGTITFEMKNNHMTERIELVPGLAVAQISFWLLYDEAERSYGHPELRSRYVDQDGPTPSRPDLFDKQVLPVLKRKLGREHEDISRRVRELDAKGYSQGLL